MHDQGFSASMPDSYVQTLQANLVGGPIDYIGEGHSTRWIVHDIEHGQYRTGRDCDHTMMKEVHDACVIMYTYHLMLYSKLSFTNMHASILRTMIYDSVVSRRGTIVTPPSSTADYS